MAIVPARDEAGRIGPAVRALAELEGVDEVVVVDDGSIDATATEASAAGARVVASARSRGKGGALEAGLAVVDADAVVFADGDLAASAANLGPLLEEVRAGRADIAVAVLPAQGGGFGTVKRFAAWGIARACGLRCRAPLSGQRVLTASAVTAVRPLAPRFGVEVAMTIDAVRAGLRVVEVEAELHHAPLGRSASGFAHRGRQGWDILVALVPRLLHRERRTR